MLMPADVLKKFAEVRNDYKCLLRTNDAIGYAGHHVYRMGFRTLHDVHEQQCHF